MKVGTLSGGEKSAVSTVATQLFPITQWSAISQARGGDERRALEGLRLLAVNYWRPLYLYLRKRGESHEDASDSVQSFFEFVFSSGFLSHVDREGGKFRSYLLKSLERWRSRMRVRDSAQKRGGRAVHVPVDQVDEFGQNLDLGEASPEIAFDRQWAMEMVRQTVGFVRKGYAARGREEWFDTLRPALPGGGGLPPYAELSMKMGTGEGAVKKAVYDLRTAFAARLKSEIRATVRTNEEAEEELRHLISVLSSG